MENVESAAKRLETALKSLEGAVDSLFERAGDPEIARRELAAMIDDRAKLADELDMSLAREKELQSLADDASAALGAAIKEVRAALGRQEAADGQG